MKLSDYERCSTFHTGNKSPINSKKRVCYRTYTEYGGLKFVSHVHLGNFASEINWSNAFNAIYDYAEVKPNPLIEMAKTRKI